jgi:hypothetical protein
LAAQPDFVAAWMLKGRVHLALMEFDRAVESFRQALNMEGVDGTPDGTGSPADMLELATSVVNAGADKYSKAVEALVESPLPQNAAAGEILGFLNRKPNLRKISANAPGPLRRKYTANEAALELIQRNGIDTRVFVKTTSSGRVDVTIWGSTEVKDLSPLREIDVSGLAIIGARVIDWQTIFSMPLDSLDFSKCPIERLPQVPRGFLRVRSLKLASSAPNEVGVNLRWYLANSYYRSLARKGVNADKVVFTGRKREQKVYHHHTGYPGGIKERSAEKILDGKHPERVLEKAVERMVPRGPLGRKQMKNLRIYVGPEHPHEAQNPVKLDVAALNPKNARSA